MASEQMAPKVAKSIGMQQSLPFDVVVDIMSRLPVKSLIRFRCVCKQWSSLTYDPHFINEHLHRVPSSVSFISSDTTIEYNDTNPYHLVKDAMPSSCKIRIKQKDIHTMSNSVHGLMCAYYGNDYPDLLLLNPFTREFSAVLLVRETCPWSSNFGFGYDVTTGKYKLVRLFYSDRNDKYCEILTLGSQEWRYLGKVPFRIPSLANGVFLDGAIYWEGDCTALVSFDVKQEKFAFILGPPRTLERLSWPPLCTLHCSAGHLFLGLVYNGLYLKIWVMEDFANGTWINLYDMDASVIAEEPDYLRILSIEDEKVLLVLTDCHRGRRQYSEAFLSYDARSRTFLKLCDKDENYPWLNPCSESLISPGKLLGNVAPL